jgi:hypothetical protein
VNRSFIPCPECFTMVGDCSPISELLVLPLVGVCPACAVKLSSCRPQRGQVQKAQNAEYLGRKEQSQKPNVLNITCEYESISESGRCGEEMDLPDEELLEQGSSDKKPQTVFPPESRSLDPRGVAPLQKVGRYNRRHRSCIPIAKNRTN